MFRALFIRSGIAMLALLSGPAMACWEPVKTPGALTFHTTAQGEAISGEFTGYDGYLCLGGESGNARMRLSVRIATVDTGLPELDDAIRGPSFLDSNRWPRAVFKSDSIKKLDDDHLYRVNGRFTLRDVTRDLAVTFRLIPEPGDDGARLEGRTTINRLDYGVGRGRWGDTQWTADEVTLEFSVKLDRTEDSPDR